MGKTSVKEVRYEEVEVYVRTVMLKKLSDSGADRGDQSKVPIIRSTRLQRLYNQQDNLIERRNRYFDL